MRRALAPAAILVLAAGLTLFGLGAPKLWVDEAETALLARSVLLHGVPKARVGDDLISQEVGREFGPDLLWRWTPWLDKYVAAGAFLLLGESTWAARLPFALLGLGAVASVYALGFGLFRDRRVALASMAFLGTSLPFLLHVRQCRYYALAILGSLWTVHFAIAAARRPGAGAVLGLAAAATVVFHANYLGFVALAAALGAALWLLGVERAGWRRLAFGAALVALVNGPWAVFFDLLGKSGGDRIESVQENVASYAALTVRYGFPVAALAAFAAIAALAPRARRRALARPEEWRPVAFLSLTAVVFLAVASAGPWSFYRYTVNLLPLFAVLLGWLAVRAVSLQRVAGGVFAALLLVTGIFHELSSLGTRYSGGTGEPRSSRALDWAFPLGNHLLELAQPFEGAMGTITDYLAAHARPGERVFVSYGDLTARFYLDLEIRGGQSGEPLAGWPAPEWVVVRSFFRFADRPALREDAVHMQAWLERSVPWREYERIALPQRDLPWESIPEPQLHWFRPPERGPATVILRRVPLGSR